jgi:hypothetical protein
MTDTSARKAPRVSPLDVTQQSAGQLWRVWHVRLPEGAVLDDLNACPEMWRNVQGNRQKAFVILDRATIVAHDGTWAVIDAVVAGATDLAVSFAPKTIRKVDLNPRTERLHESRDYRVSFLGNGYAVVRKSDGERVSDVFATPEQAASVLDRQYPRAA